MNIQVKECVVLLRVAREIQILISLMEDLTFKQHISHLREKCDDVALILKH